MITEQALIDLMTKYQSLGIFKAGELLLPPAIALKLADELADLGVVIGIVDGWYYVGLEKEGIAPDLDVDFSIPDKLILEENAPKLAAEMAKEYILTNVTKKTDLISFFLNIPSDWSIYALE